MKHDPEYDPRPLFFRVLHREWDLLGPSSVCDIPPNVCPTLMSLILFEILKRVRTLIPWCPVRLCLLCFWILSNRFLPSPSEHTDSILNYLLLSVFKFSIRTTLSGALLSSFSFQWASFLLSQPFQRCLRHQYLGVCTFSQSSFTLKRSTNLKLP